MFELTATIESNLEDVLAKVLADVQEEALLLAARELRERVAQQFQTEGAAYGNRWSPRAHAEPNGLPRRPLLVNTGRLRDSFLSASHPEHVERLTEGQLLWGSTVPYAVHHQRGTVHMPARTILTPELLGGLQLPSLA